MKGEKVKKREAVKLYTEDGEELEEERYEEKVREFWQGIYQMHGNEIEEEWGKEKRREHGQGLEQTKRRENDPTEMWLPRVGGPILECKNYEV